jgi:hypothetical protein
MLNDLSEGCRALRVGVGMADHRTGGKYHHREFFARNKTKIF